ncbi:MAG: hybrid sensor histidine kinase/response regulator, partial [Flavobacteriia bacterium]|nr:hybrid sensor histidine kinase/response regulator [Flavobacteriia bacterium]
MTQIKPYFVAIFMLLTLSLSSQNSIEKDPEILQNTINYRITQSEYDIDKFNYFEAQKKLDEALKIAESIDDKKSIGLIYSKKGKLQLIIEELNEAIVSINKAIEVQRFEKDNINLGISYKTFGDIYKSKKNYKQAIDYYISAQTLFEQEEQNNYLAEVLLCEAETFIKLKNYQKARTINEQTLALAKRFNLLNIQSSALINHGKIYNVLGDNNKALSYANEGLLMAKNNNFGEILNEGYLVLSDITQSTGDYVLSNDYLRSHLKLSDSLSKIKRENLSPEKKIKFLINDQIENSKRQEQELKEANNKNELGT